MRHRTTWMLALTLVLALAAGTALLAQDTTTATGRITNVDASGNTITVTTAGGDSEMFSTDAQSMYMANGRTINLQTLKVGDQVTITYRTSGNTKTVTHVDVVSNDTGTTPHPSATTGPTTPRREPQPERTPRAGRTTPIRTGTPTPTRTPTPTARRARPTIGIAT